MQAMHPTGTMNRITTCSQCNTGAWEMCGLQCRDVPSGLQCRDVPSGLQCRDVPRGLQCRDVRSRNCNMFRYA